MAVANPISRREAALRAESRLKEMKFESQLVLQKTSMRMPSHLQSDTCTYYVFSRGADRSFVIVSGDDSTVPILGYTDKEDFDYDSPYNFCLLKTSRIGVL